MRLMASESDLTGPVNLGNPSEITIRDLAEQVLSITGARSSIVYKPAPQDDPTQRCPDIAIAGDRLGWVPEIGLKEGLQKTVAYFDAIFSKS